MTPSETRRLALFEKLVEVLEEEPAVTLMEHLPPGGWDQVATKTDLAATEERMNTRFAESEGRIDTRFAEFEGRIDTRFAEFEGRIDTRFAEFEGRMDTGLAETRNGMLKAINRQTYIWTTALIGALLAYFLVGPAGA